VGLKGQFSFSRTIWRLALGVGFGRRRMAEIEPREHPRAAYAPVVSPHKRKPLSYVSLGDGRFGSIPLIKSADLALLVSASVRGGRFGSRRWPVAGLVLRPRLWFLAFGHGAQAGWGNGGGAVSLTNRLRF